MKTGLDPTVERQRDDICGLYEKSWWNKDKFVGIMGVNFKYSPLFLDYHPKYIYEKEQQRLMARSDWLRTQPRS